MTLRADLTDEMKQKIVDIKLGRQPLPTTQPIETFTDAPHTANASAARDGNRLPHSARLPCRGENPEW